MESRSIGRRRRRLVGDSTSKKTSTSFLMLTSVSPFQNENKNAHTADGASQKGPAPRGVCRSSTSSEEAGGGG